MRHTPIFRLCATCVLGGLFISNAGALAGQGSDTSYLPLRIGNQWTFVKDGTQVAERIIDTVRIKGKLFFMFDTLSFQPNVLVRESGPRVYRYIDTSEVLWYDFSADSATSWIIPDHGQMTVSATNARVIVPAGEFSGCRSFFWFLGADAASTEWFALGTGFVKREIITIAGSMLWSLHRAIITSLEEQRDGGMVSSSFRLEQNYPNPFNPKTVVSSQLSVASHVRLAVYDLLGREVAVLVNERRAAGSYQDSFVAGGLASGVYIYRLTAGLPDRQAGTFVQSRLMLVLK